MRIIALVATGLVLLAIAGCGRTDQSPSAEVASQEASTAASTEAAIVDTLRDQGIDFTFKNPGSPMIDQSAAVAAAEKMVPADSLSSAVVRFGEYSMERTARDLPEWADRSAAGMQTPVDVWLVTVQGVPLPRGGPPGNEAGASDAEVHVFVDAQSGEVVKAVGIS